jgi:hypothetical protein
VGYNTLETHGPVHQWGGWTAEGLLALSVRATELAASKERHCTSDGKPDAYGRPLVRCPDVARELVAEGLAMVFAVNEPPNPELVALQADAQTQGKGMWARGVPGTIVTSVHAVGDEAHPPRGVAFSRGWSPRYRSTTNATSIVTPASATAYNRVVDTHTGKTRKIQHAETFEICQVVCEGTGQDRSCMTYVPFGRQRRQQPACLLK